MKNNITIKPFCNLTESGFEICNGQKRFAVVFKGHGENQWKMSHTVKYPKYLQLCDWEFIMPIELTMSKKELLTLVQQCKDKAMSPYKEQVEAYHTAKLQKQLSRY